MIGYFTIYNRLIDPLLLPVREVMDNLINDGDSIIDIACGTGDFLSRVSKRKSRSIGIELNPHMMDVLRNTDDINLKNTEFYLADARDLSFIENKEIETATISLALHEMPADSRLPVLSEMTRIADRLIIADYSCPLPSNISGLFTRMIEMIAGKRHYAGFKSYQKNGGLTPLLKKSGLEIRNEYHLLNGIITVVECSANSSGQKQ